MIRVLLADDRTAERAALADALDHRDPAAAASAIRRFESFDDAALSVVAQTKVGGLVAAAAEHRPDVIVLVAVAPAVVHEIAAVMAGDARPILVLTHDDVDRDGLLRAGAVDALPLGSAPDSIRHRVRVLNGVTVVTRRPPRVVGRARGPVIGLVASTGGPPALVALLEQLRACRAPILVVQHIDAGFTDGFATWLGRAAGVTCRVARNGERAVAGTVYVGPAGVHLRLAAGGRLELTPEPKTLHRPSGDELLRSVAQHAGPRGVGAVLTGMGEDGAQGLRAIRDARGHTFAQDEDSSAIWGMPRAAVQADPLARVATPDAIGRAIAALVAPAPLAVKA